LLVHAVSVHLPGSALCTKYFVRTPRYELPPWQVLTFNYGLHDGADSNATYLGGISSIADQMVATAALIGGGGGEGGVGGEGGRGGARASTGAGAQAQTQARLIYFLTTCPGGPNSVPGEPVSPGEQRVRELNEIAGKVMHAKNITVVDLHQTMVECGAVCKECRPHCPPAGYQYLVDHAIAPAIKKALQA
jgi:hypothetical protein